MGGNYDHFRRAIAAASPKLGAAMGEQSEPTINELLREMGVGHRNNGAGQPHTLFWLDTGEEIGSAHASDALAVARAASEGR
jgi:hypothetical protein